MVWTRLNCVIFFFRCAMRKVKFSLTLEVACYLVESFEPSVSGGVTDHWLRMKHLNKVFDG